MQKSCAVRWRDSKITAQNFLEKSEFPEILKRMEDFLLSPDRQKKSTRTARSENEVA